MNDSDPHGRPVLVVDRILTRTSPCNPSASHADQSLSAKGGASHSKAATGDKAGTVSNGTDLRRNLCKYKQSGEYNLSQVDTMLMEKSTDLWDPSPELTDQTARIPAEISGKGLSQCRSGLSPDALCPVAVPGLEPLADQGPTNPKEEHRRGRRRSNVLCRHQDVLFDRLWNCNGVLGLDILSGCVKIAAQADIRNRERENVAGLRTSWRRDKHCISVRIGEDRSARLDDHSVKRPVSDDSGASPRRLPLIMNQHSRCGFPLCS